jgi:hypothetical protein
MSWRMRSDIRSTDCSLSQGRLDESSVEVDRTHGILHEAPYEMTWDLRAGINSLLYWSQRSHNHSSLDYCRREREKVRHSGAQIATSTFVVFITSWSLYALLIFTTAQCRGTKSLNLEKKNGFSWAVFWARSFGGKKLLDKNGPKNTLQSKIPW